MDLLVLPLNLFSSFVLPTPVCPKLGRHMTCCLTSTLDLGLPGLRPELDTETLESCHS